ncbi:MAG: insulinase family protein [bacterium]|nr:insulinase family protein [bacterium]
MKSSGILCFAAVTALLTLPLPAIAEEALQGDEIPPRPEQLRFHESPFRVPDGNAYRHTLKGGVVVYVVEDHTMPLVDVSVILRVGGFLDPPEKPDLIELTAAMLPLGGAGERSAEEFDEEVDLLAVQLSSSAGARRVDAGLNCITPVLDQALDLFFDMLRRPRFQEDRLEIEKSRRLEAFAQRNDEVRSLGGREWGWLLFGEDYFATRAVTRADLEGIHRRDLIDAHARYWRPRNMIFAVSGAVATAAILAELRRRLETWEGTGEEVPWPPPPPEHRPRPGLYHLEKDLPQGAVWLGQLTRRWDDWADPDRPAVEVMNSILGGGAHSRIANRVRADEGLVYGIRSRIDLDPFQPGTFVISFQTQSPTVALAIRIAREEVRRIRREPVAADELVLAKRSLIDRLPRSFETPQRTARRFAEDAFLGRPHATWQSRRERIEGVTVGDVQRVAAGYLDPDAMLLLVVGGWDKIAPGDADRRASMKDFFEGRVEHLPWRDPLTLVAGAEDRP